MSQDTDVCPDDSAPHLASYLLDDCEEDIYGDGIVPVDDSSPSFLSDIAGNIKPLQNLKFLLVEGDKDASIASQLLLVLTLWLALI